MVKVPRNAKIEKKAKAVRAVSSAGVTIAALTAALGDPAKKEDGSIHFIKDTADGNKIKAVVVYGGIYLYGGAYTAAV